MNDQLSSCTRVACLKTTLLIALTIALVVTFSASMARAEIKLVFGTYAADKPTATVRKLKPLLNFIEQELSKKLGEPVRISSQIAKDYDKGISQLVDREVDFARFGPASYILAKTRSSGISILAMEAVKGKRTFKGIICVREDSDISTLAQLAGKSFAFGSELSTIGRYLAQSQLLDVGITADQLKKYAFLQRHDRVGTAVGNGSFDAGALKFNTFKKLKDKDVAIRVLHSFDNVTKPWIARAGLDARVAGALREVLLNITDPKVLKSIKKTGFLSGEDANYDIIRLAIKKSEQFGS